MLNIEKIFPQFSKGLITEINKLLMTHDIVCVTKIKHTKNVHKAYIKDIFTKDFWDKYPNEEPVCRLYAEDFK